LSPLKRRGKLDDIAGLVAYLVSKEAAYITGETIRVDGGSILYSPDEQHD
jgi:NAD(P)-dependent dehydrogenase (short-subunit alcohol dehydrogenase family)